MFTATSLGPLTDALTGRHWDAASVADRHRARVRHYQRRGVRRGDRVFLGHGNTLEFFVDLAALWSLGACAVPLDARFTAFEVETLVRAARPRFAIWNGTPETATARVLASLDVQVVDAAEAGAGGDSAPDDVPAVPAFAPDDDALILFTSGTTGAPKGVVHTHRTLGARWSALRAAFELEPMRRTLCLLPTHFGHGLICNALHPWLAGQHLFITPPFRAEILASLGALLDEHRITFLSSVPTVWRLARRLATPPSARTVERVFCGSAPLSATLWASVREWTGATDVWNAYGITETGSWLAGTSMKDFAAEDGLVGVPWGGEFALLANEVDDPAPHSERVPQGEDGHLWVRTPALMRGYLDRQDLTDAVVRHGWFRTGDVGRINEHGWLRLTGRVLEAINKGGMKVYPGDVDGVAERFADAMDVCTFAVDDALLGENIGIAVVLRDGNAAALPALHEWMARHLARHQMPVRWWVLDEIPRTSRGKVNRGHVAKTCAALPPATLNDARTGNDP